MTLQCFLAVIIELLNNLFSGAKRLARSFKHQPLLFVNRLRYFEIEAKFNLTLKTNKKYRREEGKRKKRENEIEREKKRGKSNFRSLNFSKN